MTVSCLTAYSVANGSVYICKRKNVVVYAAGMERLEMTQRSLFERSNVLTSGCAVCGNCTLSAVTAGQIFLSMNASNCPPTRTWLINSGRGGHVVQLTVQRHLLAAVPEPEMLKFELKVDA